MGSLSDLTGRRRPFVVLGALLVAAGLSLLAGAERARASVGVALLGLWLLDIGENTRASACPGRRRRRRTDRNQGFNCTDAAVRVLAADVCPGAQQAMANATVSTCGRRAGRSGGLTDEKKKIAQSLGLGQVRTDRGEGRAGEGLTRRDPIPDLGLLPKQRSVRPRAPPGEGLGQGAGVRGAPVGAGRGLTRNA